MEKNSLIEKIGEFVSSNEMWNEIQEFKTTNCVIFTNSVFEPPNQKEYLCYKSFLYVVINLVDFEMCDKLGISSDEFEEVVFECYKEGNPKAKIIVETLERITDFETFREDMIRENEDAEDEMDDMIQELAQDEDVDDLNDEFLEKSLGRIIETAQNQNITMRAQKKSTEIEQRLNFTDYESEEESEDQQLSNSYESYESEDSEDQQPLPSHDLNKPEKSRDRQLFPPQRQNETEDRQLFPPHKPNEPDVKAETHCHFEPTMALGKLGPLRPLGRAELVKRNNTPGVHPNRIMQTHTPGIIKPVMRNNGMNRVKTGKVVLPPLSVL